MSDECEVIEIECNAAGAAPVSDILCLKVTGEFHVSGTVEVYFVDEAALDWFTKLVQIEEEVADEAEVEVTEEEWPPYDAPVHPFYIDEGGDICDANGWIVMVTPYGIWPDTENHVQTVLKALNKHPFLTPDEMRDNRRAYIKQVMREQGRLSY